MKILLWTIMGIAAMLCTILAVLFASAIGWLANHMAGSADLINQAAQWPVPAWLAAFFNPALLEPVRTAVVAVINTVATGLPWVAPMLVWLVPVVWVVWALVMLCLIALTSGVHYAIARKYNVN
jgi:hypothetical protein